ncbi:hypothetical protein L6452_03075 [Arctium lappa]|uniref:Uncharacterized protein n=1 Tax=Arctium lappa TaxID=4217 RepID=A0ACB9FM72_ARCLA|nr:hypothetical protein L6452_03075 [Arctium lappa]
MRTSSRSYRDVVTDDRRDRNDTEELGNRKIEEVVGKWSSDEESRRTLRRCLVGNLSIMDNMDAVQALYAETRVRITEAGSVNHKSGEEGNGFSEGEEEESDIPSEWSEEGVGEEDWYVEESCFEDNSETVGNTGPKKGGQKKGDDKERLVRLHRRRTRRHMERDAPMVEPPLPVTEMLRCRNPHRNRSVRRREGKSKRLCPPMIEVELTHKDHTENLRPCKPVSTLEDSGSFSTKKKNDKSIIETGKEKGKEKRGNGENSKINRSDGGGFGRGK